jgi:hypothetical protein
MDASPPSEAPSATARPAGNASRARVTRTAGVRTGTAGVRTAGVRTAGVGPITFGRLKWVSFGHSCIYAALLACAFVASKPEPLTFALGLGHGLLWIGMSLTCIVCARLRIVSLRLAVAVAVLGGIGPFFGSYEFVREQRRNPSPQTDPAP